MCAVGSTDGAKIKYLLFRSQRFKVRRRAEPLFVDVRRSFARGVQIFSIKVQLYLTPARCDSSHSLMFRNIVKKAEFFITDEITFRGAEKSFGMGRGKLGHGKECRAMEKCR